MIIGLGFDLVSVPRIAILLASDEEFANRMFTQRERDACAERADRAEALAARLAAKEAFLKALGTGWGPGISFTQVEVVGSEGGAPRLQLSGVAQARARELGVDRLHLTLSHEGTFAAAVVVAERSEVSHPSD
ncbi:MAG TPA: holo-ACP synthase [Gemmatimonadales bacterium]|nr:holo-ACP synthase [Gemmatimonadales bacterium]